MQFNSLWLEFERPCWPSLTGNVNCDIAILGGGIAGILSLYFLLTQTNRNVALFEKNQLASGATGYNAGLAVAFLEKPAQMLIEEYSSEFARQVYEEINLGWDLLLKLINEIGAEDNFIPFCHPVQGFASMELLLHSLAQQQLSGAVNPFPGHYLVADELDIRQQIPEKFYSKIQFVPRQKILNALDIKDSHYFAMMIIDAKPNKAARVNTAKLCYQIVHYLEQRFPERFVIYENTYIESIILDDSSAMLSYKHGVITAADIVLCTNGYTDYKIEDKTRQPIINLAEIITPREGYVAAYPGVRKNFDAMALFNDEKRYPDTPLFYFSYLPLSAQSREIMVVQGGPEYDVVVPSSLLATDRAAESLAIHKQLLEDIHCVTDVEFAYYWQGVMGYTTSGLRWVGQDAHYKRLWYNLGCNGIGVVPAFMAGNKIAHLMNGKEYPVAVFNPPNRNSDESPAMS